MLIDSFVNKHFTNKTNEQIQEIKQEAIEIANSIAEQNSEDKESLKEQLATKYDLQELKSELRSDIMQVRYDFVKWLITSQMALVAVLVAIFAFFAK